MRYTILLVLSILFGRTICAQQTINSKVLDYYGKVPQEKLYVHTDKSVYIAGDTIWMRVHMADAATNKPVCRSKFVYVELSDNNNGKLVRRIMIKADEDSVFANMIALPSDISAGHYTLTAYTQWMRNFGNDGFFYKQLLVADDKSLHNDSIVAKTIKAISVSLLPEGGHLIAGKQQRLAYKAIGDNGKGVDVTVQLVNAAGDVLQLSRSEHLGMGYLSVNVQEDEQLSVIATTKDGLSCKVQLPKAQKTGVAMTVEQRGGQLLIKPICSDDIDLKTFAIVAYGSGNLLTVPLTGNSARTTVSLPTAQMKEGVVNVAIVDDMNNVWSERLVFISPHRRY